MGSGASNKKAVACFFTGMSGSICLRAAAVVLANSTNAGTFFAGNSGSSNLPDCAMHSGIHTFNGKLSCVAFAGSSARARLVGDSGGTGEYARTGCCARHFFGERGR